MRLQLFLMSASFSPSSVLLVKSALTQYSLAMTLVLFGSGPAPNSRLEFCRLTLELVLQTDKVSDSVSGCFGQTQSCGGGVGGQHFQASKLSFPCGRINNPGDHKLQQLSEMTVSQQRTGAPSPRRCELIGTAWIKHSLKGRVRYITPRTTQQVCPTGGTLNSL